MAELILDDDEIAALLSDPKTVPAGIDLASQLRPKGAHAEAELSLNGASGAEFQDRVRQSQLNLLDFSVILMVRAPTRWFRLRRYNGKSHEHTNRIERQRIYGFHIHTATERYQLIGADEDAYAELTDRYSDVRGAIDCLARDTGCDLPLGPPMLPF
jgi:hypothetical protein